MQKRVLFCATTALLGLMAINIGEADGADKAAEEKSVRQEDSAEKPQLIISGAATVHGNFGDPEQTYYEKNPTGFEKSDKDTSMTRICAGETNIEVKAIGSLANSVKYLVDIDFDAMKDDTEVDKMYISFAKDGWGTLQMGNLKGPAAKCIFSGQRLLGGTTGLDGTVPHEFDFAAGVISPLYPVGYSSKATKVVYYSPKIYGLQLGFAITPDTKQHGHNDKNRHAGSSSNGNDNGLFQKGDGGQKPAGRNNIELALTHTHEFKNGIGTKFSAIYVCEQTKPVKVKSYEKDVVNVTGVVTWRDEAVEKKVKLHNASSFLLSATVSYQKWSFGVGYLNNGKSRTPKEELDTSVAGAGGNGIAVGTTRHYCIGNFLGTNKSNAGQAWNFGAQYRLNDNWTFSGVFHHMTRKVDTDAKTHGNAINLAAEYKICDGLMVFFEWDYVRTKSCDKACERYNLVYKDIKDKNAIKKQTANLFVVGAKISF